MSQFDCTVYPKDYAREHTDFLSTTGLPDIGLVTHRNTIKVIMPHGLPDALMQNLADEFIAKAQDYLRQHIEQEDIKICGF